MIGILTKQKLGPIGIDVGTRSVKLVQLNDDRTRLVEAARWDLPFDAKPGTPEYTGQLVSAIKHAREGRKFRGKQAVLCLGSRDLFVQNLRVPKTADGNIEQVVRMEAADRVPFPAAETELRFIDAADVRQGDSVRREVIVLACHKPVIEQALEVIDSTGMRALAIEIEPTALLRCYGLQYRRDADQTQRSIFVHVGNSNTLVVIAQGDDILFVKYIELGGRHFDEAVARNLKMEPSESWALRRHNGDRRTDQQDPEVVRSVAESIRPVVDKLVQEVSLCLRYYSVTFRGQPLARLVLGGGEATDGLLETLNAKLDLKCEMGDPLRAFEKANVPGRKGQWDVALGLALKPTE